MECVVGGGPLGPRALLRVAEDCSRDHLKYSSGRLCSSFVNALSHAL